MSKIPEWKAKRKKALIAVCTLGLSQAPWGFLFSTAKDADKGFSFEGNALGVLFRILSFFAWTILSAGVIWIINIFKLLNYSISIYMYERKN